MTRYAFMLMTTILGVVPQVQAQVASRPADTPRGVTLALTEYNRLTDLATPRPSSLLPAPAVLSTADLRIRVDANTARGDFALAGEVLQSGPARVTLLSNATILGATAAGQPLPLIADGRTHHAIVNGPGPFAATVQWGAPLTFAPGRASFVLPVPPAGTARATIDLPGEQADVHLSAGVVTRRSVANGRTIVEATLDPSSATEVWWSMRDSAPAAAVQDTRTVADVLTLITLGDAETRMHALIDLTVLRGELRTIEMRLPPGYQLTGITGSALEATDPVDGRTTVTLAEPAARHHQFLVSLEQAHKDGAFAFATGFIAVGDVQRERGEVAIEGTGTLDLTADGGDEMHRIDVRELNAALKSLARTPMLAAFRYQRSPQNPPQLAVTVTRFGDSPVLAAVVEYALATTLVTGEGRALTEVMLHITNHAQPFLKVLLPAGASIVSVEVEGAPAKQVTGDDGTRVPLLRPGFRPSGAYDVSFVYLQSGTPFTKKGDATMVLPRMDIPVGVVSWEVFAPEAYTFRHVDGNVIANEALSRAERRERASRSSRARAYSRDVSPTTVLVTRVPGSPSGNVGGKVFDTSGAVLPGVTVTMALSSGAPHIAITDGEGSFTFTKVPRGLAHVSTNLPGFTPTVTSFVIGNTGLELNIPVRVGALEETITMTGEAARADAGNALTEPSVQVVQMQQRVAGLLPVPIDVPRAGVSHRFTRPLVLDEETTVSFRYKRR